MLLRHNEVWLVLSVVSKKATWGHGKVSKAPASSGKELGLALSLLLFIFGGNSYKELLSMKSKGKRHDAELRMKESML